MSAWKLITTDSLNVNNQLLINSNPGNNEDVILNIGGVPSWSNIFGKISKYTDGTDSVQDLNADINISFDTEVFNNANISYGVDFFRFNDSAYYYIDFSCLLSNDAAQTMISFFINGTQQYGLLSYFNSASVSTVQTSFNMSSIFFFNNGDELRIFGQKTNSGPNYLLKNPVYGSACTQLLICKL